MRGQGLTQTLLNRINRELHRNVSHIARDVLQCLELYHWPGNVRELENVLMKSVALSSSDTLTGDLRPDHFCNSLEKTEPSARPEKKPQELWSLEEIEKSHIARVLESTAWHKGQACEILGVSRPRLRRMIRQYGLSPPGGSGEDETDDGQE